MTYQMVFESFCFRIMMVVGSVLSSLDSVGSTQEGEGEALAGQEPLS